jgi:hypothetical protein
VLKVRRWLFSLAWVFKRSRGFSRTSASYSSIPQSWSQRDEGTVLARTFDKDCAGWNPQHEAIAQTLSSLRDEKLIHNFGLCLPSDTNNPVVWNFRLCSTTLGYEGLNELGAILDQMANYNTASYYTSCFLVQESLVRLHPETIELMTRSLVGALDVGSRVPYSATTFYRVRRIVYLLDILVWTSARKKMDSRFFGALIRILEWMSLGNQNESDAEIIAQRLIASCHLNYQSPGISSRMWSYIFIT